MIIHNGTKDGGRSVSKMIKYAILSAIERTGLNKEWIFFTYECYLRLVGLLKYGSFTQPRGVFFELNEACNRKCSYCPVSSMPPRNGKMTEELFLKITDELRDIGFKGSIEYTFYNEPLLDKRLPAFVSIAKHKLPKSLQRIYTNGDFLTKSVYAELDRAGIDSIIVTDHDNRPDSYFLFCNFSKVHFQRSRDLHLLNRGGLVNVKQSSPGKIVLWLHRHILGGCWEATHPVIGYNGVVHLCCHDALKRTNLGDLTKESFRDIMERSKPIRKAVMTGKFTLSMCEKCREYTA